MVNFYIFIIYLTYNDRFKYFISKYDGLMKGYILVTDGGKTDNKLGAHLS